VEHPEWKVAGKARCSVGNATTGSRLAWDPPPLYAPLAQCKPKTNANCVERPAPGSVPEPKPEPAPEPTPGPTPEPEPASTPGIKPSNVGNQQGTDDGSGSGSSSAVWIVLGVVAAVALVAYLLYRSRLQAKWIKEMQGAILERQSQSISNDDL
jgi:hypothetical protein